MGRRRSPLRPLVPMAMVGGRPRPRRHRWSRQVEPGVPAEGERAVHQRLVAADRRVGADAEVGPGEFVPDLLVALLDPVAGGVDPNDFGQVSGREGLSAARGEPGRGRFVARYQVFFSGRVAGAVVATTWRVRPSGPQHRNVASAAHRVAVCPSRKARVTGVQPTRVPGPFHFSSCAAARRPASSAARASRAGSTAREGSSPPGRCTAHCSSSCAEGASSCLSSRETRCHNSMRRFVATRRGRRATG